MMTALPLFPEFRDKPLPVLSRIEVELLRLSALERKINRRKWYVAPLRRLIKLGLLQPQYDGTYRVTRLGSAAALHNAAFTFGG